MARPELVPDPISEALPTSAEDVSQTSISSAPRPEPSAPMPTGPIPSPEGRKANRLLIVVLVIALLGTSLALLDQSRRAQRLTGEVAVLEAEVATTASVLEAYQIRFEQVRGEVGDLLSKMSALSGLVARDVVPAGLSDADGDTTPATDTD